MNSIHDLRVYNFAIVDVLGTIIIAYIVWKYTRVKQFSLSLVILVAILFGVLAHVAFGVNTTLNNILGLSQKPDRYKNENKLFDVVTI
jgi:hypothetical protein